MQKKHSDLAPSKRRNLKLFGDPKKPTNAFDKIVQHMQAPEDYPLDEATAAIYKRWKMAYDLLSDPMHLDIDIRKRLQDEFGIGRGLASTDINAAKRLYAFQPHEKNWLRAWALELARRAARMAVEDGDTKEFNRAIANIINLAGLDKDDVEAPTLDQLEANTYVVQINVHQGDGHTETHAIDLTDAPELDLDAQAQVIEAQKRDHPLDSYDPDAEEEEGT